MTIWESSLFVNPLLQHSVSLLSLIGQSHEPKAESKMIPPSSVFLCFLSCPQTEGLTSPKRYCRNVLHLRQSGKIRNKRTTEDVTRSER